MELSDGRSKNRVLGRPRVRDIEWEVFRLWEEARGFSGFSLDTEYTCFRLTELFEFFTEDEIYEDMRELVAEIKARPWRLIRKDNSKKKFLGVF